MTLLFLLLLPGKLNIWTHLTEEMVNLIGSTKQQLQDKPSFYYGKNKMYFAVS